MRTVALIGPGHRHQAVGHLQYRVAGHERGGVAVGAEPEVDEVEAVREQARRTRPAAASRSGSFTGMATHLRRGLAQALAQVGEVPVGVAVGGDPFVDLEDLDRRPRDLLVGQLGEHRPRGLPPAHGEREAARGRRPPPGPVAATIAAPRSASDEGSGRVTRSCSIVWLSFSAWPPNSRAHGREDLVGEVAVAARLEPLVERGGDDRGGDARVDGGLHRPATLARVRHPPGEVVEVGGAGERVGGQVDEPRPDHRAPSPQLGHLGHVDVVLVGPRVAQRGGLGVGLEARSCRRRRA